MKLQQGFYLLGESFGTLGRHKGVTTLSVIIMSLTLLVLAVFLLATDNMLVFLDKARQELKVYVYLRDEVPQVVIEQHYKDLLAIPEVESITYISKAEALHEFRNDLGEDEFILETLESNPLPASFRITLKPDFRDEANTELFAGKVTAMSAVEEVNYGKDFLKRFSRIARGFLYVDVVLGFIVIISSVFIISNTVRLTILSRKKTIEILKLVGATNRFITTPFVMEGAFQGGLASMVSLGLLLIVYTVIKRALPDLAFLAPDKITLYVLTCVLLGSIGSYAALRRFLRL